MATSRISPVEAQGLINAGATGICGMARILALMPWNRQPSLG